MMEADVKDILRRLDRLEESASDKRDTVLMPTELLTLGSLMAKGNIMWAFSSGLGIGFNW